MPTLVPGPDGEGPTKASPERTPSPMSASKTRWSISKCVAVSGSSANTSSKRISRGVGSSSTSSEPARPICSLKPPSRAREAPKPRVGVLRERVWKREVTAAKVERVVEWLVLVIFRSEGSVEDATDANYVAQVGEKGGAEVANLRVVEPGVVPQKADTRLIWEVEAGGEWMDCHTNGGRRRAECAVGDEGVGEKGRRDVAGGRRRHGVRGASPQPGARHDIVEHVRLDVAIDHELIVEVAVGCARPRRRECWQSVQVGASAHEGECRTRRQAQDSRKGPAVRDEGGERLRKRGCRGDGAGAVIVDLVDGALGHEGSALTGEEVRAGHQVLGGAGGHPLLATKRPVEDGAWSGQEGPDQVDDRRALHQAGRAIGALARGKGAVVGVEDGGEDGAVGEHDPLVPAATAREQGRG
eukprot:scaffold129180_cov27-Tisochrysis_lutea.AAC.3